MNLSTADWVGVIGVTLLLVAFGLNLLNKLSQTDLRYILLNCVGAALACTASMMIHYLPFVVLEGVWTVVSLVALVNNFRKKHTGIIK